MIDQVVAALTQSDQAASHPSRRARREVRQLFRFVLRCVRAGRAKLIIRPSEQIAALSYAAGIDLAEVQGTFTVLAEVLWRELAAPWWASSWSRRSAADRHHRGGQGCDGPDLRGPGL